MEQEEISAYMLEAAARITETLDHYEKAEKRLLSLCEQIYEWLCQKSDLTLPEGYWKQELKERLEKGR